MKRLVGALMIVSLAAGSGWFAFSQLSKLTWFRLVDVQVRCPEDIAKETVLEVSDLKLGESIFCQDFKRAGSSLLELPGIEAVRVRRKLPASIEIDLAHEKVVLFVKRKKLCGLTRSLKLVKIDRPVNILPIVTGLSGASNLHYDDKMKLCYALAIKDKLNLLSENLAGRLSEIHFCNAELVELFFDPGGVRVLLPLRNHDEALTRLSILDFEGILGNSGFFDMTAGRMITKNGV